MPGPGRGLGHRVQVVKGLGTDCAEHRGMRKWPLSWETSEGQLGDPGWQAFEGRNGHSCVSVAGGPNKVKTGLADAFGSVKVT